jgi:hypothetical protein
VGVIPFWQNRLSPYQIPIALKILQYCRFSFFRIYSSKPISFCDPFCGASGIPHGSRNEEDDGSFSPEEHFMYLGTGAQEHPDFSKMPALWPEFSGIPVIIKALGISRPNSDCQ